MASFDYTVDIERNLLKIMTSSQMMCRAHLHGLEDDLFSSLPRQFIVAIAKEVFADSKSILSRTVYEYEVGKRVDGKHATDFIAEWNMIEALDTNESPDVLIDKLHDAKTGRRVLQLGEEIGAFLEEGRIDDAVSHIKQTSVALKNKVEDRPTVEVTDIDARKKMIEDKRAHPEKFLGIKTGFPLFDKRTGGLFKGELTLLAGVTGVGKSTLVKQIERGILMNNEGKNILHIMNEEYQEQVEHKFDAGFVEVPYMDFKLGRITDEDMERWEKFMRNWKYTSRLFLKEVPAFTDVTLVEHAYFELQNKGINIDVIVIDHLPHIKPIQRAWDPNDELKKAASDCKEIAKSLRVACVVPTQAATIVADKQEKGKRAGQMDVYGSKGQIHVANTFMIVTEQGKDDDQIDREEWERDVYWMCDVKKNRDGPKFNFRAKHHVRYGKIEEIRDENSAPPDPAVEAARIAMEKESEELKKQENQEHKTEEPISNVSAVEEAAQPEAVKEETERQSVVPASVLERIRKMKKVRSE